MPDVSRRQPLHQDDEGEVRQGVQDLHAAAHRVPLVPRRQDAVQEDGGVSDLRQAEEHLPDLPAGPGVRAARPGQGRRPQDQG